MDIDLCAILYSVGVATAVSVGFAVALELVSQWLYFDLGDYEDDYTVDEGEVQGEE